VRGLVFLCACEYVALRLCECTCVLALARAASARSCAREGRSLCRCVGLCFCARASMWRCGCASARACWHWHMLQVQGRVQGREDHCVGAWARVFVRVRVCGVAAVRVHLYTGIRKRAEGLACKSCAREGDRYAWTVCVYVCVYVCGGGVGVALICWKCVWL